MEEQGLKVGFTNGCFDLLHRGHLYSLEQARAAGRPAGGRGQRRRLRGAAEGAGTAGAGPRRRASAVLAALRFVDLVVPFDEDTPEALIKALGPDVLFKGADYAEAEVVGGDHVKANGGRVELLPLLPGHSTTGTVKRMRPET